MSFIRDVAVVNEPEGTVVKFYIPYESMTMKYAVKMVEEEIVPRLVEEYVKLHGDEILKRINDKVIDQKVIAKVVERLRKEMADEKIKKGSA